jgi:AraC-like DNA-binding protein
MKGDPLSALHGAFCYYERLERVRRHVDQHLDETILLADVARVAHLERKYFSAYFRRVVGVCFRDWLTEYRIHRAVELLRSHDVSISRVAETVGFQNLRSFQRAFRRHRRTSASSFRAAVRETFEIRTET